MSLKDRKNKKGGKGVQSMDEIYQAYAKTVYKFLLSKTHDENLAEELTQETFYQAIKSIDRFDGKSKLSTWLCAIAKNQWLVYQRKHPIEESIDNAEISSTCVESEVFSAERRVELMKKLHLCPEPLREILYLRIFGSLSFREIGEIMGKTENWARVNFYRAKERLKKEINQNE